MNWKSRVIRPTTGLCGLHRCSSQAEEKGLVQIHFGLNGFWRVWCNRCSFRPHPVCSAASPSPCVGKGTGGMAKGWETAAESLFLLAVPAHPIFDVVVDDKIQFFVGKPIVFCQHPIYFVYDGLRELGIKFIILYASRCFIYIYSSF